MKIISLNGYTSYIEVFRISDEDYAKWCIDHNEDDDDYTALNEFITAYFRDLGYDDAEFKQFQVFNDDETIRVIDVTGNKILGEVK